VNVLVVDTSAWISYLRGKQHEDLDSALQEGRAYLTPVVAAELLSGVKNHRDQKAMADFLEDLPLCRCDPKHWFRTGELRAHLLAAGITMSTPDAHIAQCTLDLKGYLLSEDAIFKKIEKMISLRLL
jgi:tRNA(fMet)-specific endonuclease VapC